VRKIPAWLGVTGVAAVVAFVLASRIKAIKNLLAALYRSFLAAEAGLFRKLPK
jgi:hypothetical protein